VSVICIQWWNNPGISPVIITFFRDIKNARPDIDEQPFGIFKTNLLNLLLVLSHQLADYITLYSFYLSWEIMLHNDLQPF
jgi:hypothetical protein